MLTRIKKRCLSVRTSRPQCHQSHRASKATSLRGPIISICDIVMESAFGSRLLNRQPLPSGKSSWPQEAHLRVSSPPPPSQRKSATKSSPGRQRQRIYPCEPSQKQDRGSDSGVPAGHDDGFTGEVTRVEGWFKRRPCS